jgi:GNAT superfamily N-acetyltransferase
MQHMTAQVEEYSEAIAKEVVPLLQRHYEEIAIDKDEVPLDPDWDRYRQMADTGMLSCVSLRSQGILIGYCVMMVGPELHYRSTLCGTMDIFWVAPEHRQGTGGLRLMRAVHRELLRRGVKRVYMGSKLHQDISRLYTALGYVPVELWFSMLLKAPVMTEEDG